MVQKTVVSHIDKKLGGGRVGLAGTGHGHGVGFVFEAVIGFVVHRFGGFSLLHAGLHAAALDHEARNDAVEYGVVVVSVFHIFNEVIDALGRFFGVQFQGDNAVIGNM